MLFRQLFESETSTYTYLLADEDTREAVLIDPVRETLDRDVALLNELELKLVQVLETHVHADHITSAGLLRERYGARTGVSEFGGAACADVLLKHGDVVHVGAIDLEVRQTPGHTNGCVTYVDHAHKMAFTGDTLLIRGCGRTDFQDGDSRKLYRSVHEQIFTLDDDTAVYPGHDYKGRTVSSVGEEKRLNPRLGGGKSEDAFVDVMSNLKLAYPKQIDRAVPANLKCGLPEGRVPQDARVSAFAPIVRDGGGVPEVEIAWVKKTLEGRPYRLIDVREPDELLSELGAIDGVENVPMGTVERAAEGWDRKHPLVVVCRSGGRSGRVALALEAMGFQEVASMAGGMLGWR